MEPPRVNEVIIPINLLNSNKSHGQDDIPPFFLQVASCILAATLCYFIDNAFQFEIFLQSCKIAKIIPIYKAGKANSLTNYRPISILTCFSKVIEKLIHKHLTNFFQKNSFRCETQYGFQSNLSTTHALLDVLTSTCHQITVGDYTGLILLDFKKAFDTVCHKILLRKLKHYGIRGQALKLLNSFLHTRHQYVSYQNKRSKTLTSRFGVPEGSNLGPLLFLIYINDLPSAINSVPRLFANNTCSLIHSLDTSTLAENINSELANVHEWTMANKITVNPEKSLALIIPPKITTSIPDI